MGALSGIKVLDMSRIVAGPWCTQTLADLGAEVIKIERPKFGDDSRGWGPPNLITDDGNETREATYYLAVNRGKHSVAVNLSTKEGQDIIRELARDSDVLIENFKVGGLAQYGLDYESLSKINPRLVYCSITGFGQYGPRANEPGYDFVVQGLGGLMSITGERDDLPGGGPQKAGVAVADYFTGLYAAIGIQAALFSRETTGKGQFIDIALLDTQVAIMANQAMNYLSSGNVPPRYGNAHENVVPYQVFKSADDDFILACGNDSQFKSVCEAIGLPELAEKYPTNSERIVNRKAVISVLAERFLTQPALDWINIIKAAKVPADRINNIRQALEEPQIIERGLQVKVPHPLKKDFSMIGSPIQMSGTPIQYDRVPPQLGEHTQEVLQDRLKLSDETLKELAEKGVIGLLKK